MLPSARLRANESNETRFGSVDQLKAPRCLCSYALPRGIAGVAWPCFRRIDRLGPVQPERHRRHGYGLGHGRSYMAIPSVTSAPASHKCACVPDFCSVLLPTPPSNHANAVSGAAACHSALVVVAWNATRFWHSWTSTDSSPQDFRVPPVRDWFCAPIRWHKFHR